MRASAWVAAHLGRSRAPGASRAALAMTLAVGTALAGGCASKGGAKVTAEGKPAEPATVLLRQDVDRLRGDLTELRAALDRQRQSASAHTDLSMREIRSEVEAVQRAIEATSRNDLQRQVEVLDAQAKRIDLLEKRAAELGQMLRRVELAVSGMESQLARVLDTPPAARPAPRAPGPAAQAARGGTGPSGASPEPWSSRDTPAWSTETADATPSAPPAAAPSTGAAPATPAVASTPSPSPPAIAGRAPTASARPRTARATPADASSEPAATPRAAKPAPPAPAASAPASAPPAASVSTVPPAPSATPAPAAPNVPAGARPLFDRAMDNWKKGETGQAVLEFEELVQTYPADPLVAPAQFWIGEAYYTARDYERATAGYRKAVELAPKGKDTPQALLRLGLVYRAQKKDAEARQAWNQLVREFPNTDSAEEARRALRGR